MTLDIGFLGYGFMGKAHASALDRLPMFFPEVPETDRHVIVGRDGDALATAADRLGFETTATDWRQVIDDVDVLYNLGPNHVHPEPCIAALDADVHVLCEKPLAHTLAAAERMAEAARASAATAAIAFNYRFVPAIQYARDLIADGAIGDVRAFEGRYRQDWLVDPEAAWSWRNDESLAGSGALGDLGAHTVDLARYLVGDIERVSGHLRTFVTERPHPGSGERRPVTVDDAYTAQAEFAGGAMATLEGSRVAPGHKNDHSIQIHGTAGSLRFSLERLNELAVRRESDRGYERVLVTEETDPYVDHWWPPGHVLGWEHTVVHENAAFLSALDSDDPSVPSFENGLAVQRVLEAIQRAAETDGWREVGDIESESIQED